LKAKSMVIVIPISGVQLNLSDFTGGSTWYMVSNIVPSPYNKDPKASDFWMAVIEMKTSKVGF
jgi:hypothetical protein